MVTKQERGMSRKVTSLERENERLRELLSIARGALLEAAEELWSRDANARARGAEAAYRRSDPDASTEDVTS